MTAPDYLMSLCQHCANKYNASAFNLGSAFMLTFDMPLALLLKGHITFTILMFQEEEKESPSRQRRRARREAERVKEKNKTSGKDVEKVEDRVEGVTKVDDISNLQDEFCPDNIYSDKGTENESLFDETSVKPRPER